ncbi:MAG: hypothetical protein VYC64_18115, partial [Candidatus Latescibacterota bacterium]|nr:hypothetical protein [Candidatus Latescibacterota bacterium]
LGVETLRRYADLIAATGETYLWYFPDGRPSSMEASTSPDATATDGWGSSAILFGLVEGLAGVTDVDACFRRIEISPRWAAAEIETARVHMAYAASGAGVGYVYEQGTDRCRCSLYADGATVHLHLLLPAGKDLVGMEIGGQRVECARTVVGESVYADADLTVDGQTIVELRFT